MKLTAPRLLVVMTALVWFASTQPQFGHAADEESIDDKVTDNSSQNRKIVVSARDEKGEPLPGTQIKVNVLGSAGKKTIQQTLDYFTGADGSVEVKLPQNYFTMQLWAFRSKHVAMYASFEDETDGVNKGNKDIAAAVPPTFDFVLKPGTKVGGIVVDEMGQPISGVKVRVSSAYVGLREAAHKPTTHPKPSPIDPSDAEVTDNNGRWFIDEMRQHSPNFEYHVQLRHDDYVSDTGFGKLQHDQNVTTAMLITGEAKIVMRVGPRIMGTVADAAGHPVTNGVVIWNDDPYFQSSVCEARLNEKGEFRSSVLSAGDYPVTVAAAGFMPERHMIKVSDSPEKVNFVLQPGKRLAIRIQDAQGNPLPQAYVRINGWRSVRSLYSDHSSNAFDLGIPMRPNQEGLYVWDWAPADAVTFSISVRKEPSNLYEVVSLAARQDEHLITLRPPLTFSGTVTDAVTGRPIDEFSAIPVFVFRPKWLMTDYGRAKISRTGGYEIKNLSLSDDGRRFHIRIEANGYRTAISEKSYDRHDGAVTLDFALTPAASAPGRVINLSGEPVAGAFVIQGTPSIVPTIANGAIAQRNSPQSLTTDEYGRFRIAASFEPARIRVIHPQGFAEVLRKVDERPGTLTLQPWAKVSGTLRQDGKPIDKQTIQFHDVVRHGFEDPRFEDYYETTTDANGHFTFDRLPPTVGYITTPLRFWDVSPLRSSRRVPVALKPGDNPPVSLGATGITVTGKVARNEPADAPSKQNWSMNYLIRRGAAIELPAGAKPVEIDLNQPIQFSWSWDDHFIEWLAAQDCYVVTLSPDGGFQISGVPAGEYDLFVQLYDQPAGGIPELIGRRIEPIVVTDSDVAAGSKDVGRIGVECRVGPRVGQSMQSYQFVDADGRQKTIQDLRGQYVVAHVWASWSYLSFDGMTRIQSMRAKPTKTPIQFVGWNVDDDADRAKAFVAQNNWDWPQTWLGANAEQVKQLAIGGVPLYYLIDREGLLVTSANDWSTMQKAIDELK